MTHIKRKAKRRANRNVFFASLTLSFLIACTGLLYGTYARQKDSGSVQNNLKPGTLIVNIREDDFVAGMGITAGEEYDADSKKEIKIVSGGSYASVVRIMVMPVIKEAEGGDDLLLDTSLISFVNRNTDWINGDDGYWYYTKVLAPGETVTFCGNVELGNADSEYDGFTLNIDVLSEAKYITSGTYPHEIAWWGSSPNTTDNINTVLRTAIDIYAAANWN